MSNKPLNSLVERWRIPLSSPTHLQDQDALAYAIAFWMARSAWEKAGLSASKQDDSDACVRVALLVAETVADLLDANAARVSLEVAIALARDIGAPLPKLAAKRAQTSHEFCSEPELEHAFQECAAEFLTFGEPALETEALSHLAELLKLAAAHMDRFR